MRQKPNIRLAQKQKISLKLDVIDMLSVAQSAESLAERLVAKYDMDMEQIKKEILSISVPKQIAQIPDFNFREEVLWAVGWIMYIKGR